jgi:transposase
MKRIDMKKVRELLRLSLKVGLSYRRSSQIVGIGKSAGSEYIAGFKSSGISIDNLDSLSDTDLIELISPTKDYNSRYQALVGHFSYIEKELKREGVTMQLLWKELCLEEPDSYSYSQFCYHYSQWKKKQKVSMHIDHKAGDKMFVDFTGAKQYITNPTTGEQEELEVFVAVLGCSQRAYIEAVPSQRKQDWIKANENALRYFGGVPKCIVPDCLKSAVVKSDKYEPTINESYNDFARHYGTVILPARALHPQDKALAENFVKIAYQRIYAPLRNTTFFSLEELNEAMWEQLDKHNQLPFQGKDYSREQLFNDVEKGELNPLPVECYDMKEFASVKVQYNHHIYLKADKHYYSVPFQLTGKRVSLSYNSRIVEVSFNNKRVAIHNRNYKAYGYTTNEKHRPQTHQFITQWNAPRFIKWAASISTDTENVIKSIMEERKHPEQAYKTCMGIMSLSKKYPQEEFIKACKRSLEVNRLTYRFISNTLKNKAFNITDEEVLSKIPLHSNIRGKERYN